jgi:hypothetical protein
MPGDEGGGNLIGASGRGKQAGMKRNWSGRPGSNRRHSAWEADVLPLNYSRSLLSDNKRDRIYGCSATATLMARLSQYRKQNCRWQLRAVAQTPTAGLYAERIAAAQEITERSGDSPEPRNSSIYFKRTWPLRGLQSPQSSGYMRVRISSPP